MNSSWLLWRIQDTAAGKLKLNWSEVKLTEHCLKASCTHCNCPATWHTPTEGYKLQLWAHTDKVIKGWQLTSSTLLLGFVSEGDLLEESRGGEREVRESEAGGERNTNSLRSHSREEEAVWNILFLTASVTCIFSLLFSPYTWTHTPSQTSSSVTWLSVLCFISLCSMVYFALSSFYSLQTK